MSIMWENSRGAGRYLLVAVMLFAVVAASGCKRSPEARCARYLEAGRKLMAKKDARHAVLEFRNAAQANPKSPEAFYELGRALLEVGDPAKGVRSLQRALELNPKHNDARLRLAQLMAITSDRELLEEAQQRLKELLADAPQNPGALHALALTELKLGAQKNGMDHLEQAVAAAPQELAAVYTLAQAKWQQQDFAGAEVALKKAVASAPKSADALVLLGEFYQALKRLPEAEQQLQRATVVDPNHAVALFALAHVESQMGKEQEADRLYQRMSALPDKSLRSVHARYLYENGKRAEAVRELEALVKDDADDRQTRTHLIRAYMGVNRAADARKVLDNVLRRNSKDLDALLQRSELLVSAGEFSAAETDLEQLRRLEPNATDVHYVLAKLNQSRGATPAYRQELGEVLRLNPLLLQVRLELARSLVKTNPRSALGVLDETPQQQKGAFAVQVERNWALWETGNLAEMRKGIDRCLAVASTVDLLLQDAYWKMRSNDASGARATLEGILKANPGELRALQALPGTYAEKDPAALAKIKEYAAKQPQSAPVQNYLGGMLMARGDRVGARAALALAKAADPKYVLVDLSLVQLDSLEGKWDDARKRLETVVAANPGDATARLWLAHLEEKRGNHTAAIENYRKVMQANPEDAEAANNLASLLSDYAHQPDEALKYAQKAVELAPAHPAYNDTLGWVLYSKGLYAAAVRYLEQASAARDANVVWKYHLAMAYTRSGDVARGRTTLAAALRTNPDVPEARQARELIGEAH